VRLTGVRLLVGYSRIRFAHLRDPADTLVSIDERTPTEGE
jgi:hypothetical protein